MARGSGVSETLRGKSVMNETELLKLKNIEEVAVQTSKIVEKYSGSDVFRFFHLRPKETSIEIVSLLPHSPMRGIETSVQSVCGKLDKLQEILQKKNELSQEDLSGLGFKERGKETSTFREEDVQAAFCFQQLQNKKQFDGIGFVTTEFLLVEENKRIDILGAKDCSLYVFELKRERENPVYNQIERYCKELRDNFGEYLAVLKYYPNIEASKISDVKPVAVMPWAQNHQLRKPQDISNWLYEESAFQDNIIFHKEG
jgi:hypothetical protein